MVVLVASAYPVRTLLCKSDLLVLLEFLIAVLSLDRNIRPRLCEIQAHLPSEQVEALEVVDGVLRAVDIVVNDKGLALALETLLGDDVDDGVELVEEAVQGFDQGGDLDGLVEVANVYPFSVVLVSDHDLALVRTVCNVRTLRWVRSLRRLPWLRVPACCGDKGLLLQVAKLCDWVCCVWCRKSGGSLRLACESEALGPKH